MSEGMRRIDGDDRVALGFSAMESLRRDALTALESPGVDYADRCIVAAQQLAKAENVMNQTLCDLERVTGVPWTALMMGGQI